jgi:hypothetical protein
LKYFEKLREKRENWTKVVRWSIVNWGRRLQLYGPSICRPLTGSSTHPDPNPQLVVGGRVVVSGKSGSPDSLPLALHTNGRLPWQSSSDQKPPSTAAQFCSRPPSGWPGVNVLI